MREALRELRTDSGKAVAGEILEGGQKAIKAIAIFQRFQLRADVPDVFVRQFFAEGRYPCRHARGVPAPIIIYHARDALKAQMVEVVLHSLQEMVDADVGLAEDLEDFLVGVKWVRTLGLEHSELENEVLSTDLLDLVEDAVIVHGVALRSERDVEVGKRRLEKMQKFKVA